MEAVGLLLGSIPIIISVLEHYPEGIRMMRRSRRYTRELASIARRLRLESSILQNTCEKLLENFTTYEELEALIAEPGGARWKDRDLDKRLRGFLGSSYMDYKESVDDMVEAKKELEILLRLDSNGKAPQSDKHSFRDSIKFIFSSREYEGALSKIEKYNNTLSNLTDQNKELAPARKRRHRPTQQFKFIQAHAENLYHSIKGGWNCDCGASHDANLRLVTRLPDTNIPQSHLQDVSSTEDVLFKVLFPVKRGSNSSVAQWAWQETDIRLLDQQSHKVSKPLELFTAGPLSIPSQTNPEITKLSAASASASPTSLSKQTREASSSHTKTQVLKPKKGVRFVNDEAAIELDEVCASISDQKISDLVQIKNICSAMHRCMDNMLHSQNCVGYLFDHGRKPFGIYLCQPLKAKCDEQRITSLTDILRNNCPTPSQNFIGSGNILRRGDRLRMALTIASSVLQLYQTPWLRENWNRNDIKIGGSAKDAFYEEAYISKSFSETTCQTSTQQNPLAHLVRNETLFALGILLIELCFGRPFETMRSSKDPLGVNSAPDIMTDWSAATRLMSSVNNEAGRRYGDVVRRCIYCEFDKLNTTLENDEFRQAVYDGVVAPLEDDMKDFFQLTTII